MALWAHEQPKSSQGHAAAKAEPRPEPTQGAQMSMGGPMRSKDPSAVLLMTRLSNPLTLQTSGAKLTVEYAAGTPGGTSHG